MQLSTDVIRCWDLPVLDWPRFALGFVLARLFVSHIWVVTIASLIPTANHFYDTLFVSTVPFFSGWLTQSITLLVWRVVLAHSHEWLRGEEAREAELRAAHTNKQLKGTVTDGTPAK